MIKLERNSTKSFINIELRFSRSIIFIRERDFNFKIFNNNKYYKISIVLKKNRQILKIQDLQNNTITIPTSWKKKEKKNMHEKEAQSIFPIRAVDLTEKGEKRK